MFLDAVLVRVLTPNVNQVFVNSLELLEQLFWRHRLFCRVRGLDNKREIDLDLSIENVIQIPVSVVQGREQQIDEEFCIEFIFDDQNVFFQLIVQQAKEQMLHVKKVESEG